MYRIDVDRAIVELNDILMLTEPASEALFQEWGERNSAVVFPALGYRRAVPHPRLPTPGGGVFIPDFMALNNNGLWEVVELKTGEPAIYKERERRSDFYQAIHECISQCREYSEWLGHEPARNAFETTYQTRLARHPPILMIAGSETDYNRREVAENLAGRTPAMRLFTWGDVVCMLNGFRSVQYGETQGATGCAVVLNALFHQSDCRGPSTIVDIGEHLERDRIHVTICDDRLMLRVLQSDGAEVTVPAGGPRQFDVPTLLAIEVATLSTSVRIGVEIDRQHAAQVQVAAAQFHLPEGPVPVVVGADMRGKNSSMLTLILGSLGSKPMSPAAAWAIQRFAWLLGRTPSQPALRFEGKGQFMYAEGHPTLDPGRQASGSLVQRDDALRPTMISLPAAT